MRYLKTKLGTFWIAPALEYKGKYFLGVDDEALWLFDSPENASKAVAEQTTGFLNWDAQLRVKAPQGLQDWEEGEPKHWAS